MPASREGGALNSLSCIPSLPNAIIAVIQIERAKVIKHHFLKVAQEQSKEGRKMGEVLADGVIVGVGLISKDRGEGDKRKH